MRVLIVSNLYPPHFAGGYELGCYDVAERLAARGHAIHVVTSTVGSGLPSEHEAGKVERILSFENQEQDRGDHGKARRDCPAFARIVQRFSPDVIYFWNQTGLTFWLVDLARLLRRPVAFFLSDTSFTTWRTRAFLLHWSRADRGPWLLRQTRCAMHALLAGSWWVKGRPIAHGQACHFASEFLRGHARRAGLRFREELSLVAHWGIDVERFRSSAARDRWPPRKLLFAGQLIPEKGVKTAIEALSLLGKEPRFDSMTLTLAGGSSRPEHEQKLRALPAELGIAGKVHFLGKVPRADLPAIYSAHDVLVFPSIWEEPFAITPLEAIASGLAVAGTVTGGSGELFEDRITAMVFAAGNAEACAAAIREVCSDRERFESLRQQAFARLTARHTLDHMVDLIEAGLQRIARFHENGGSNARP